MRRAVILFCACSTAAVAGDADLNYKKYKVPTDQVKIAIIRFPKGHLRLSINRGDAQYYGVLRGAACSSAQRLTVYDAGIGGNTTENSMPIEAGHKLRIIAAVQKQDPAGYQAEQYSWCTRIVEFAPEAGRTYTITQEADATRPDFCAIDVREAASGALPADVAEVSPMACRF